MDSRVIWWPKDTLHAYYFFSCEGAALEVLMYVCLSVRPLPDRLKFNCVGRFQKFPDCFYMFLKVFLKVSEGSWITLHEYLNLFSLHAVPWGSHWWTLHFMNLNLFGSDTSSRNANLRLSFLRPSVQTCLEHSIFIILTQIFKQSVRNKSAVSEHSESTQRAIREHSEHQNKSQYSRSLKYCVLLI